MQIFGPLLGYYYVPFRYLPVNFRLRAFARLGGGVVPSRASQVRFFLSGGARQTWTQGQLLYFSFLGALQSVPRVNFR
jgi:hypothetical protein